MGGKALVSGVSVEEDVSTIPVLSTLSSFFGPGELLEVARRVGRRVQVSGALVEEDESTLQVLSILSAFFGPRELRKVGESVGGREDWRTGASMTLIEGDLILSF